MLSKALSIQDNRILPAYSLSFPEPGSQNGWLDRDLQRGIRITVDSACDSGWLASLSSRTVLVVYPRLLKYTLLIELCSMRALGLYIYKLGDSQNDGPFLSP